MRIYKTTWDEKEVNKLARDGYVLHTAIAVNGLIQYVMEYIEQEYKAPVSYGVTQFGDH